MAFHLKYEEDGKLKREQFNSYYECIRRKEVLRNKGIRVAYKESGQDITRSDYTCRPINQSSKKAISQFLKMCDNIGDFHNFKSV